jgi:UDP-glucose 4-epimerase
MFGGVAGQRVLVSGASGFIGSHLCERLLQEGAEVHAVAHASAAAEPGEVRWWRADLAEVAAVRELFAAVQPDTVFHLAGWVAGGTDRALVLPTFRSNLMSTVNVLDLAADGECGRVLLAGSSYEREEPSLRSDRISPYAVAKLAASQYAAMFNGLYGLPVVTLRVYMAYGPAQRDDTKLIPYVVQSLLREESPHLTNGYREVDWVYVDDVVEAFLTAAATDGIEGRTFDVGSGALVSIRETAERIHRLVGSRAEPVYGAVNGGPREALRLLSNPEATRAALGWAPRVSLDEGLVRTVEWYRPRVEAGVA